MGPAWWAVLWLLSIFATAGLASPQRLNDMRANGGVGIGARAVGMGDWDDLAAFRGNLSL